MNSTRLTPPIWKLLHSLHRQLENNEVVFTDSNNLKYVLALK